MLRAANRSLREHLHATLPVCDSRWMSESASNAIHDIAARLPDAASSIGFEVRLARGADRVDFGVSLRPGDELAVASRDLVGRGGGCSEGWRGFGHFIEQWVGRECAFRPWVPFAFLELDADCDDVVPCVFASFDWPLLGPNQWAQGRAHAWEVARAVLVPLMGEAWSGSAPRVKAAFDALPFGGRVIHAGAMLGRSAGAIRLSVSLPHAAMDRYLDELGLDARDHLAPIWELIGTHFNVHLECDLTDRCGERVGVVLTEQACIERAIGLASSLSDVDAGKVAALREWSSAAESGNRGAELERSISHWKVNFEPGRAPELKAYLTATLR